MTGKLETRPETNRVLRASAPIRSATLRPSKPTQPDLDTSWLPYSAALERIAESFGSDQAEPWLMRRVLLGMVPISCQTLFYGRDDGPRTIERRDWPNASVRLAEQLAQANELVPASRLRREGDDFEWFDASGPFPVNALMMSAHVGLEALSGALAKPATRTAQPTTTTQIPQQSTRPIGTAGRIKGSGNYPTDPAIVEQVIAACDAADPGSPLSLRRAIVARLDDIEPKHADDESKIRRIRKRAIHLRPDLRT